MIKVLPTLAFMAALTCPALAADRTASCLLEVNGHAYLRGPCTFSPMSGGSFSIGGGKTDRSPFFAYVTLNDDGTADAFWNKDPKSVYADVHLGAVTRNGACWSNSHAKICAQ